MTKQSLTPVGMRGVSIESKGDCGWGFTPILTFPHQGGRNIGSVIIAALDIHIALSAPVGERLG